MFVAILAMKDGAVTPDLKRFRAPADFDLLIKTGGRGVSLPKVSINSENGLHQALNGVAKINEQMAQRIVPIPICLNGPSSSNSFANFACVPVLTEVAKCEVPDEFRFCNLDYLLNLAMKQDKWLDLEAGFLIGRLEE